MKRIAAIALLGLALGFGAGCDDIEDIEFGFDYFGGPSPAVYVPGPSYVVEEVYFEETYYEESYYDDWSIFPW